MSPTTAEGTIDTGPRVVVAELPPALSVSKVTPKSLPNWGLKTAMAITGVISVLFVAFHLYGNLKVYTGPEHFNDYAAGLRHLFEPILPENGMLWIVRIGLGLSILIHICCGFLLWRRGRVARGAFAAKRNNGFRSISATLMPITGIFVCCFLVIHILGLTLGVAPFASDKFQEPTGGEFFAYQNLVADFQRPWSALVYVVMMVLLSIHVSHGIATMASDLGAIGRRWRAVFVFIGGVLAVFILLGNASIPISVLAGWLS